MFVNFWKTVSFLLVLENVARLTRGVGNDNNLHQFSLNFAGRGLFLSDKKPRARAQEGWKDSRILAAHTLLQVTDAQGNHQVHAQLEATQVREGLNCVQ